MFHLASTPLTLARRAVSKARRLLAHAPRRRQDLTRSTYVSSTTCPGGELLRYLQIVPPEELRPHGTQLAATGRDYLAHRFDLLGSGWVQVRHGMDCRGVEGHRYAMSSKVEADTEGRWLSKRINPSNRNDSRCLWHLVDREDVPVDWHLDFKSGYRWSESTWYRDIRFGHAPGADIKVPWELSRMQHLPQLAWLYALALNGQRDLAPPRAYLREFRNQVLDFMATNPPRFGVNWVCTMDVAIRVANWLVAYDLYRAYGAKFDDDFEQVFRCSIYQHGQHIIENLEWHANMRGNHYLSDVVGLLFVAAYLPRTPETDTWLAFAVQELVNEVESQFHADGSNFEASTSYHRLAAELVVYATALVLGLPPEKQEALSGYDHSRHKARPGLRPAPLRLHQLPGTSSVTPFPAWYLERLERMAEFTLHITRPDRRIPQIGDNDSGRFLKLFPVYRRLTLAEARARYVNLEGYDELPADGAYWDEDHLDHRHLVAAINGLFDREDFSAFAKNAVESQLVRNLAQGIRIPSYRKKRGVASAERVRLVGDEGREPVCKRSSDTTEGRRPIIGTVASGGGWWEGLALYAYPDFGLYVYRSNHVHLVVRCGSVGQNGYGGHAHNDQLSFELSVGGQPFIVDPGTYVYTPLPEERNRFRSTAAHNTLCPEGAEQNRWKDGLAGLFSMTDCAAATALTFTEREFAGRHSAFVGEYRRWLKLLPASLCIADESDAKGGKPVFFHLAPGVDVCQGVESNSVVLSNGRVQLLLYGSPGDWFVGGYLYSAGYGLIERSRVVWFTSEATRIELWAGENG